MIQHFRQADQNYIEEGHEAKRQNADSAGSAPEQPAEFETRPPSITPTPSARTSSVNFQCELPALTSGLNFHVRSRKPSEISRNHASSIPSCSLIGDSGCFTGRGRKLRRASRRRARSIRCKLAVSRIGPYRFRRTSRSLLNRWILMATAAIKFSKSWK
jgi:hypothetical protein